MKQLVHYYRTENRSNFHTKYKIFFPQGNALWVNGLIALKCFLCLPDDLVLLIVSLMCLSLILNVLLLLLTFLLISSSIFLVLLDTPVTSALIGGFGLNNEGRCCTTFVQHGGTSELQGVISSDPSRVL